MRDDFKRLLAPPMDFLDNLSIEVSDSTGPLRDYVFPNGTIGKIIVYNMEERERIKIGPDFEGSKKLELSKIDEALRLMQRRNPARHVHRRSAACARSRASSAT